ncbi:RVP_2 domain-containing protein [Tanacetum coccineum]
MLKTGGTLKSVQFSVQEVDFVTDFHVLPVHGCDMVLGNSWLRSLGPVLTNHSTFSMSFFYQDIGLKGRSTRRNSSRPIEFSGRALRCGEYVTPRKVGDESHKGSGAVLSNK